MTAAQFAQLSELMPVFAKRMRAFDLDSTEPVASVILASNEQEIAELITSHPEIDFYVSRRWASLDRGVHEARAGHSNRIFLLARSAGLQAGISSRVRKCRRGRPPCSPEACPRRDDSTALIRRRVLDWSESHE